MQIVCAATTTHYARQYDLSECRGKRTGHDPCHGLDSTIYRANWEGPVIHQVLEPLIAEVFSTELDIMRKFRCLRGRRI